MLSVSLPCDKFIVPARYEPVELCVSASVCSCHPSDTLGDRGVQRVLCGLHEDWHVPVAPPTANPPLPQEASMLLPCLIMWARCLGGSLCHPVTLSASIIPLSGHPSGCSTQFVYVCVCLSVCGQFPHPQSSLPLLLDSFHIAQKQVREGGGYYSPEGVHTNALLKCHSIFNWPVYIQYLDLSMCLFNLCPLLRVKFNLVGRFTQLDDSGALGSASKSCHPACRLIKACVKICKMTNSENQRETKAKQSTSWKGLNDI